MQSCRNAALVAAAMFFAAMSPGAWGQEQPKWSEVDCAASHIVGPTGLKCRHTQVYSGGNSTARTSAGAGGQFQHWNMYGTVNKAKVFYFLKEAVGSGSSIFPVSLEEAVTTFSIVGKNAKNFSPTAPVGDGDYARFAANDDACIAVRKNGPTHANGYRYYLLGTKCVSRGQQIPDGEVAAFLSSFTARN